MMGIPTGLENPRIAARVPPLEKIFPTPMIITQRYEHNRKHVEILTNWKIHWNNGKCQTHEKIKNIKNIKNYQNHDKG